MIDETSQAAWQPRPRATQRSSWAGRDLYYALYIGNGLVVFLFWYYSTGHLALHSTGDVLNALGRITGLEGTYLVLWQLLLMTRQPWLDSAFGLDRLAKLHRWNGYLALCLLLAHALLQTLGYQLIDRLSTMAQLGDFMTAYDGLLPATAGLLLLVLVVGVSITIARRRLAYETWYFVHLYTYLAIALAFAHELAVGSDFIANRAFASYWLLLYGVVAACLLGFRVVLPLVRYQRHRFRVERLQREAAGVTSIYVRGRDLARLHRSAGQFMIWRFLDRDRWYQAHPFSVSLPPGSRVLRLTIKRIGDFSGHVATIRPGTPVLIEGPFGSFTGRLAGRRRVLLIAGGIGITPLRALAEELADEGRDVCLLYRCRREQDVVFRAELQRLASRPNVRVEFLLSQGARRGGVQDPLAAGMLQWLVPDVADRDIFICGPQPMMRLLRASLGQLGVPTGQVHSEGFRL